MIQYDHHYFGLYDLGRGQIRQINIIIENVKHEDECVALE